MCRRITGSEGTGLGREKVGLWCIRHKAQFYRVLELRWFFRVFPHGAKGPGLCPHATDQSLVQTAFREHVWLLLVMQFG